MKKGIYKTSDVWLASFLLASNLRLERADWEDGKLVFGFEDEGNAEELIRDFMNDIATVQAKRFVEAFRNLKSLIYTKAK